VSYKSALQVLATFTEQVVPIHNHINLFCNSLDIRNKNSHNETNKKASGEVIWQHSHYIFIELPVQLHDLQKSWAGSE